VTNSELVLFTPYAPLGFRVAAYTFLDVGAVAGEDDPIFTSKFYASFGLGVRVKNPRLVFDALQLQVSVLPTTVDGSSDVVFKVGGSRRLSLDLLDPKPSTIAFR
jgi:hypothetical protein